MTPPAPKLPCTPRSRISCCTNTDVAIDTPPAPVWIEKPSTSSPDAALPGTLIVHGENDERVALAAVLDWARPQSQPVMVVPGADHFFTGKLPVLRTLVVSHLASAARP